MHSRTPARLDRRSTDTTIRRLRTFVASGYRYPTRAVMDILKCSRRKAQSILNVPMERQPLLRRVYASNMAAALKIDLRSVCGLTGSPQPEPLVIWKASDPMPAARAKAGQLAMVVAARAFLAYDLDANYTVTHRVDGRPNAVRVILRTTAAASHAVIFRDEGDGVVFMDYVDAEGTVLLSARPSRPYLDKILTAIRNDKIQSKRT